MVIMVIDLNKEHVVGTLYKVNFPKYSILIMPYFDVYIRVIEPFKAITYVPSNKYNIKDYIVGIDHFEWELL